MRAFEFWSVRDNGDLGDKIGTVHVSSDGTITADSDDIRGIVEGWKHAFPENWQDIYLKDGWSNGYVILQEVPA